MERYAVIGSPVQHSLSPVLHALFAATTGKELQYDHCEVSAADFEEEVRRFQAAGGNGLNITLPHKVAALQIADQATPRAHAAGAANWLSLKEGKIAADNTDGSGLVRDLTATLGLDLSQLRILLLGAGGAARGVLGPLLEAHPHMLTVANRTEERAQELVAQQTSSPNLQACGLDALEGQSFDLILNATAVSLEQTLMQLPDSLIEAKRGVCYDFVYGGDTPFLRWARDAGCTRAYDGLGMLIEQAAESFALWHGVWPDTAPMRAALGGMSYAP